MLCLGGLLFQVNTSVGMVAETSKFTLFMVGLASLCMEVGTLMSQAAEGFLQKFLCISCVGATITLRHLVWTRTQTEGLPIRLA